MTFSSQTLWQQPRREGLLWAERLPKEPRVLTVNLPFVYVRFRRARAREGPLPQLRDHLPARSGPEANCHVGHPDIPRFRVALRCCVDASPWPFERQLSREDEGDSWVLGEDV